MVKMTFEDYRRTGNKSQTKERVRTRSPTRLKEINQHINFTREGEKTNARKDPTRVTCINCGKKFILPFKPRKPEIYCDSCFKKRK